MTTPPPRCPRCGHRLAGEGACLACGGGRPPPAPPAAAWAAGAAVLGLVRGMAYVPRAAGFLLSRPRLALRAVVPLLLNAALLVAALGAGLALAVPWVNAHWVRGWLADWSGWWWGSLAWAIQYLVVDVAVLGTVLALAVLVGFALAAVFHDALSREVERVALGLQGPLRAAWEPPLLQVVVDACQVLAFGIALNLAFLALAVGGWVFAPVAVVAMGLGLVSDALFVKALPFVELALGRRGYGFHEWLGFLGRHRMRLLGFGLALAALCWVPLLNVCVLPLAATGGTLLYLESEGK
ncbi:MAG: EI24 domain-containing protein [Planctomycetes bacterium]|nr:EI24 domain-containing protein [Planctomycetota bacterium]